MTDTTSALPILISAPTATVPTVSLTKGHIRFRRLPLSQLMAYPLVEGEPGLATDTHAIVLGTSAGNVGFMPVDTLALSQLLASLTDRIATLEGIVMSYSAKTQLNWRGAYAAGTTYAANDEVYYQGSTVVSLQNGNTGNTPPVSPAATTAFWGYAAQAGATGSTGAAGASAASGIVQRSFNANMNPLTLPPAGTTLDEITYDLSAGTALSATLYARQLLLDTRIKTFGSGTLTLLPPSGFTIDGAATFVFNGATKDAFTMTADPANANNYEVS